MVWEVYPNDQYHINHWNHEHHCDCGQKFQAGKRTQGKVFPMCSTCSKSRQWEPRPSSFTMRWSFEKSSMSFTLRNFSFEFTKKNPFQFFVNSFAYYGLTMNIGDLAADNVYLNFTVSGQVPAFTSSSQTKSFFKTISKNFIHSTNQLNVQDSLRFQVMAWLWWSCYTEDAEFHILGRNKLRTITSMT